MADETSDFDAFSAAYDKAVGDEPITTDEPEEAAPEAVVEALTPDTPKEEPEAEETAEAEEEAAPVPEAPTYLPEALRKHWAALPEDAREAVDKSQRGMSDKLAEASRIVQGLAPIQGAIVQAAREMPHLKDMRPDQVAGEIFELAKISAQFNAKPVETLMGLIDKHNMRDAIRQYIGGNPEAGQASAATASEIASLKAEVARLSNPEYLRDQIASVSTQERAVETVTTFMKDAEHWAAVEDHIPVLIPAIRAKLGDAAPPAALLKEAYELAVSIYLPDKVKPQAGAEPAPVVNPARAEAAKAAKAVNITGKVEGKPRAMSERESFFDAYDRAARK